MARLAGKVALVTGGGTGIGREISLLFAEEGARVAVVDIRPADGEATVQAIRDAGGVAIFVEGNVAVDDQLRVAVHRTTEEFGALHVTVANAGIAGRGHLKPLLELTNEDFADVLGVNLYGVVNTFRHAIPAIRASGGGAMTATASLSAHRGYANMTAYCASKGAVVSFVMALATELAPDIRVNAVSPGTVATEMAAHAVEEGALTGAPSAATSGRRDGAAYTRAASPRELANAHLFLVSDEASFVNGQCLIVDNGRSIYPA